MRTVHVGGCGVWHVVGTVAPLTAMSKSLLQAPALCAFHVNVLTC
jgi:hypothetical protein